MKSELLLIDNIFEEVRDRVVYIKFKHLTMSEYKPEIDSYLRRLILEHGLKEPIYIYSEKSGLEVTDGYKRLVCLKDTIPNELKAGQLSLHHPMIVHGSTPNRSKSRRIGFVIQSYIGANVDQVIGKVYVQQARGIDKFKYHEHTKRPVELMSQKDVALRIKANEELSKIFYSGAKEKGKY